MKREKQSKSFSLYECQKTHQTHYHTLINLEMSHLFSIHFYFSLKKSSTKKRNLEKKGNCLLAYERFLHGTWGHAFSIANLEPQTHRYYLFFRGWNILFQFSHFLSKCVWERECESLFSFRVVSFCWVLSPYGPSLSSRSRGPHRHKCEANAPGE